MSNMSMVQALVSSFNALVEFNTAQGVCAVVVIEIVQASVIKTSMQLSLVAAITPAAQQMPGDLLMCLASAELCTSFRLAVMPRLQDLILVGDGFNAVLTLSNEASNMITNTTVNLRFFNSTGADVTSSGTP